MPQMVHDHTATSVNKVFRTTTVLGCGKKMKKTTTLLLFFGDKWEILVSSHAHDTDHEVYFKGFSKEMRLITN